MLDYASNITIARLFNVSIHLHELSREETGWTVLVLTEQANSEKSVRFYYYFAFVGAN